jgi:hypothetical protein
MHCLLISVNGGSRYRTPGSHRIATHMRMQGWDAEVLDFVEHWTLDELKEFARSRITKHTQFVGFSFLYSFTTSKTLLEDFCKHLKEQYPDVLLIGGGQFEPHNLHYIDYFVAGYGENALDAILKYKFSNGPAPIFKELHGTRVVETMHDYPAAPWKNPTIIYEDRDFIMPDEWGFIEFARGCKFDCAFCNYPIRNAKFDATRDSDNAYHQLVDAYDRFGMSNYTITDSTFNDATEKISKFADVVERLPFKPWFTGFIRADLLISRKADREELLRLGMLGQFYGIESFNPKSTKFIGKGMSPSKIQEGLLDIKEYFIKHAGHKYRPAINLIAGLPHETKESLAATYEWIKNKWHPLYAHAEVLEIVVSDNEKNSHLSKNHAELGYHTVNFPLKNEKNEVRIITPEADTKEHYLQWENQHMTIYQAEEWVKSLYNIYNVGKYNMRVIDALQLSSIMCDNNGDQVPLEKKLFLTDHTKKPYEDNFIKFVQQYKHKKLSL